jgi:hypothetical protein
MFAAHKTAILGAAAAGVAGLALLRRKKGATTAAASTSSIPGTIPAAAIVAPGTGGVYDSSSYDLYNALQPEIEQLMQTRGGSVSTAPTPVASSLFGPSSSNNLVRFSSGAIDQIQSDGSLYNVSPSELQALYNRGGISVQQLDTAEPTSYGLGKNLTAANPTH